MAGLAAAAIFGQVTVNETMTARYIAPALRARMYSVRFFVGFLGSRRGGAGGGHPARADGEPGRGDGGAGRRWRLVTLGCAWFFPDQPAELRPELWAEAPGGVPAE